MRTLVIDYARNRQAEKRGGAFHITRLPTQVPEQLTEATDLERMGAAIDALAEHDTALAQLVDLKFFCGYSLVEIAAMRGRSRSGPRNATGTRRACCSRVLSKTAASSPASRFQPATRLMPFRAKAAEVGGFSSALPFPPPYAFFVRFF